MRSLTMSLAKLSQELATAKENQELCDQLAQTKLDSFEARQALQTRATVLGKRLVAVCRKTILEAWKKQESLQEAFDGLPVPNPKKEESYRQKATRVASMLAQTSAALEQSMDALTTLKHDLQLLEPVRFLEPSENSNKDSAEATPELKFKLSYEDAGGDEKTFFQRCREKMLVAKVHVALVAGISLLRNPELGKPTQPGKLMVEKVGQVHSTLTSHLEGMKPMALPKSPHYEFRAFAEIICGELAAASNQKADPQGKEKKRKVEEAEAPKDNASAKSKKLQAEAENPEKSKKRKPKDGEEPEPAKPGKGKKKN